MSKLKYQPQIIELNKGCIDYIENLKGKSTLAFRWVFKDKTHPHNFIPPYIIKTSRISEGDCSGYALSFFTTIESACDRYNELARNKRNFHKIVGNSIAQIDIETSHGKVSVSSKKGHFDLFEYEETDFNQIEFEVVMEDLC